MRIDTAFDFHTRFAAPQGRHGGSYHEGIGLRAYPVCLIGGDREKQRLPQRSAFKFDIGLDSVLAVFMSVANVPYKHRFPWVKDCEPSEREFEIA